MDGTRCNTALSLPSSGPNSRFVSIHNGARLRHLARARLRHLARREVPVQVRARRLREHDVVRGVVGAHPLFWTRSSSICGAQWCYRGRQASFVTVNTQDILIMTDLLFRVFVVVLSSITSGSVVAAAASSLMRFSSSAICRGDEANPWLESAFITHFGCVSSHRVVCFPQSLAIACFRRVSPLLVFLLGLRCQQKYGALVVFLVLRVCVNEFLGHASFAHRDGRWYGSA